MGFYSILFEKAENAKMKKNESPAFFSDLNLDQIINSITADRDEYDLKPYFYTSLNDAGEIDYRHKVTKDLENKILFRNIKSFSQKMSTMRQYLTLSNKLYYKYHKEGWFLEAVNIYCEAVNSLANELELTDLKSSGFLNLRKYLAKYVNSSNFVLLFEDTKKLKSNLSGIKYCILIDGNRVKVRKFESEVDFTPIVEKTFKKFRRGSVKDYKVELPVASGMNHVEAKILEMVARLYPDIFLALDNYYTKNQNFQDETIITFDREVQFYIAYLEHISKFKEAGLKFCYPQVSNSDKEVFNYDGFDLALANKLIAEGSSIVCNSFYLKGKERIFVVSGPNQGGKTTFARTFGQLHYLACLGLPVPGRKSRLFIYDRLFTHFEKEENIKNLRGKLLDDLKRIFDILNQASSNSIIVLNEIFTSTTLKDAVFLSKKIMEKIINLDALSVWVTFIDELASLSEKTVSMVSTVHPDNPALRTYKIVRKPADGLAYAISIAEKYRLTYNCLKERLKI